MVFICSLTGHKDTRTPLFGAFTSAACSLSLNALFLQGRREWEVWRLLCKWQLQLSSLGTRQREWFLPPNTRCHVLPLPSVLQLGVAGSAFASTLASTLSCAVLCGMMVVKGMVNPRDLATPPTAEAVWPMMRAALPLTLRNVVSFGARFRQTVVWCVGEYLQSSMNQPSGMMHVD